MFSPVVFLFLGAATWIFVRHDNTQPDATAVTWAFAAAFAVALLSTTRRHLRLEPTWSLAAICAGSLAVAAIVAGDAIEAFLIAVACPFFAYILVARWPAVASRLGGPLILGAAFLLQVPLIRLFRRVALQHLESDSVASLAGSVLGTFYDRVATSGATILVSNGIDTFELIANWEQMAVELLATFTLTAVALGIATRRRPVFFILTCLGAPVFAFLRFVALAIIHTDFKVPDAFFNHYAIVASCAPFALLVALIYERSGRAAESIVFAPALPRRRLALGLGAAGLLAGMLVGFGSGFHDPGGERPKKLLVDEHHSNWEWTTIPLERDNYGVVSMYNYRSMLEYLQCFYTVDQNKSPLTLERLSEYDALIVKTPTEHYGKDEIDAIEEYVRRGGGLIVIGEHTNVFGTSEYSNAILDRFGLRFAYDATYDVKYGRSTVYEPPPLLTHPIVRNVDRLVFASSCTIEAPLGADDVINGYEIQSVPLDYSTVNFFTTSDYVLDHPHRFGRFLQAAAIEFGRGRVSLFSDSTMFSNFCTFLEGRPELLLGYVEWTGRENRLAWIGWLSLGAAALAAAVAVVLAVRGGGAGGAVLAAALACVGWATGARIADALDAVCYGVPEPVRPPRYVTFDLTHCPAMNRAMDQFPTFPYEVNSFGYSTFFIWTQRVGLVPRISRDFEAGLDESSILVLLQPARDFTEREFEHIDRYLHDGGVVLVLESLMNTSETTSRQVLNHYGIGWGYTKFGDHAVKSVGGKDWGALEGVALKVTGGDPWLLSGEDDSPLLVTKKVGRGTLAVCSVSKLFCDGELGYYKAIPSDDQRLRSELIYALFDRLLERSE